jgi:hypothetical protein
MPRASRLKTRVVVITRRVSHVLLVLSCLASAAGAQAQLFESSSKRRGSDKMDIVIKEVERRDRVSVLEITINVIGSSVGSSFFLLCSIRQLALERGNYRYVAKIEERPKRGQMIVGFLRDPKEELAALGPEFQAINSSAAVIDLEQFEPICGAMK